MAYYDPLQVLKDLQAALEAGGVPATLDIRDLNPPGVLIELESISHNILSGAYTLRARLLACVADTGAAGALAALGPLLGDVLGVVTPNTDTDTTYEAVPPPDGSQPWPALVLRVDIVSNT